jgi:AcrR family transcriptional regulator
MSTRFAGSVIGVSTSPGLRERKKEQTRQAIRETALRLFGERGFEAVTLVEIAEQANVSVATLFNYFPRKEDLVYAGMEAYELALISAIRDREPGESVLTAFSRFVLDLRGLLASKEPQAAEQLAAITRIITESPELLARERELLAQYTDALAALIGEETRAAEGDITPWVAANALMGVSRALRDRVRRGVLAGTPNTRLARDIRSHGKGALAQLELGLGDYAIKPR